MSKEEFERTVGIYEKAWHDDAYMKKSALDWVETIVNLFFPPSKLQALTEGASALDAGCGAGLFGASFFRRMSNLGTITFLDATSAVNVAENYIEKNSLFKSTRFVRSDLKDHLNISENRYDVILSCGVIHHDSDPKLAFMRLVQGLKPGGCLYLWVYSVTNEMRNLTDNYVRAILNSSGINQKEILNEIVTFGKYLHDAGGIISVKSEMPWLGIAAGEYSIHEFVHAFFLKAFYNPTFDKDRNYLQNLDWFAVPLAKKFSEGELIDLCFKAGLEVIDLSSPTRSGISLIGRYKG